MEPGGHAHILVDESDSFKEVFQFGDGTVGIRQPLENPRDLCQSFLSRHH